MGRQKGKRQEGIKEGKEREGSKGKENALKGRGGQAFKGTGYLNL